MEGYIPRLTDFTQTCSNWPILSGMPIKFYQCTRRHIPADSNFHPHTVCVCVCVWVSTSVIRSTFQIQVPHCPPRHCFAHSTHYQHVICVLCVQQISNCDAHLFVPLSVIAFLYNNRQEAVSYWLMSSNCHAHHEIHLRVIKWHLFYVALLCPYLHVCGEKNHPHHLLCHKIVYFTDRTSRYNFL